MIRVNNKSNTFKRLMPIGFMLFTIGIAIYSVVIDPMLDPSKYKEIQKYTRKDIKQEDVQPGGMKVWSDPFDRK